jgi:serine O-acetyltransferase
MSAFFANEKRLARLIREDWKANFRDWTLPGFRALAVHRFGNWVQQLRWAPVRVVLRRIYTAMFRYVRNHYGIELPVTASVGRRVVIGHQSGIVIHANAVIGDDCFLRQNVTIGATTRERGEQAPTLGSGVFLGCGSVILGGITIGDRVRIGPNSVVMTDVPADTSVFTSTPRMIRLVNAPPAAVEEPESRLAGREP